MTHLEHSAPRASAALARAWAGPAILARGFRPFFLAAGVWAVLGIAIWPPFFEGLIDVPTALSPIDWHVHEMIFGYAAAVIAGFLLTAIPNWTGRLPVSGFSLAGLAGLWAAGRIAVFFSAALGRPAAGAIDAAFLFVFAAVTAREVIEGRNWRNLRPVGLALALALVNVAFHVEDARSGLASFSTRAALAVIVMLILLIGGRVIPSFTGNWLAKTGRGDRPVPFGGADSAMMALSGLALALWIARPEGALTGALALAAGAGNLWRLSRWRGLATRSDALVLVLHAGFFLAAAGFFAAGAHALLPDALPYAASVHVWAIGAIGVMTLAMMTRVTLGHSGQALHASFGAQLAYFCVVAALAARVAMALLPELTTPLMDAAAGLWILAFAAFLVVYAPMLLGRVGPR